MNPELKRYRRQVKRKLRCVGRTRRALLDQLDQDLARYAAEEPLASYSDAVLAIGTPSEVAAELNETLTQKDETRYWRRKWWLRGAAAAVFILMAGCIGFVWKELSTPIVYEQVTIIYEEQPDPEESEQSATETDTTETEETDTTETEETDPTETEETDPTETEETDPTETEETDT